MGILERKEREKEKRIKDIVSAAEDVFFSKGYENASMDEIAAKAELSKGTLYIYFKSKEELFFAFILRGLTFLQNIYKEALVGKKSGADKCLAIIKAAHVFSVEHPDYFNAIMQHHVREIKDDEADSYGAKCNEKAQELFYIMNTAVIEGIKEGSINPNLDPALISLLIWSYSNGLYSLINTKKLHLEHKLGIKTDELLNTHFMLLKQLLKG